MEIDPDRLYPPALAAAFAGITPDSLRAWERRGTIHPVRNATSTGKPGHRRYYGADLIRAIDSQKERRDARNQLAEIMRRFSAWHCFADGKGHYWAVRTIDVEEVITVHGATIDAMFTALKESYIDD